MTRPFRLTKPEPSESAILAAVLQALALHPAVGGFWRQNTGAFAVGEGKNRRFIRFGVKGLPDICGYLKDGRALYTMSLDTFGNQSRFPKRRTRNEDDSRIPGRDG